MSKLSTMERTILINRVNKTPKKVAEVLGISEKTVATYMVRVRRKRQKALNLIQETNRYKSILYPKRKGE